LVVEAGFPRVFELANGPRGVRERFAQCFVLFAVERREEMRGTKSAGAVQSAFGVEFWFPVNTLQGRGAREEEHGWGDTNWGAGYKVLVVFDNS